MATLTVKYAVWIPGGRSNRRRNGRAAYNVFYGPTHSELVGTLAFQPAPQIASHDVFLPLNGQARFAFWSISGGDRGVISQNLSPEIITIGSADIVATAWFLPIGGSGDSVPGAWIDAFDITNGEFVDDAFVNVTSNPILTTGANNEGWVPSNDGDQTVVAIDSLRHDISFINWEVEFGNETIGSEAVIFAPRHTFTIGKKKNAVVFAFYESRLLEIKKINDNANTIFIGQYGVDGPEIELFGGGIVPRGPGPNWNNYMYLMNSLASLNKNFIAIKNQLNEFSAKVNSNK